MMMEIVAINVGNSQPPSTDWLQRQPLKPKYIENIQHLVRLTFKNLLLDSVHKIQQIKVSLVHVDWQRH